MTRRFISTLNIFATIALALPAGVARAQCTGAYTPLPPANLNGPIRDVIQYPNGALIVGGAFSHIAVTPEHWIPCRGLAFFDGSQWSVFAGGANDAVTDLIQLENGDLIASGSFSTIGGVDANFVARSDGSTWTPLGNGPPLQGGYVGDMLQLPSGDLLLSGHTDLFTWPTLLYRWNGQTWSAIPTEGLFFGSLALDHQGNVITTFVRQLDGGLSLAGRWDGSAWHVFPAGQFVPSDEYPGLVPLSLLVDANGDVIVGGGFKLLTEDHPPCSCIARWDGTEWQPMATGLNGPVWSLAQLPSGDIVAGGLFWFPDREARCHVARWDGAQWSPLIDRHDPFDSREVMSLSVTPTGGLLINLGQFDSTIDRWEPATSDFNGDGDFGADSDIEAFFACLAGNCCPTCYPGGSDFNSDGDSGTDADIESFFRVLGGGNC